MLNVLRQCWVHEESGFYVLAKPVGLSMHDSPAGPGIVTLFREMVGDRDIFPCHRLDNATSGLLLLAKGKANTRILSDLFFQRQIQKYYVAISAGKPKKKQGAVVGDMLPARDGCWKLAKTTDNPAVTQFFSYGLGGFRLFVVKPSTGKTHQIRVALKSLSAGIIGDERYAHRLEFKPQNVPVTAGSVAQGEAREVEFSSESVDRMYLHALSLTFNMAGEHFHFYRPPEDGVLFLSDACQARLSKLGEDLSLLAWPETPLG